MDILSHFHPTLSDWMHFISILPALGVLFLTRWLVLVRRERQKKRAVRSRLQMRLMADEVNTSRLGRWERALSRKLVATKQGARFATVVEQAYPGAQPVRVLLELILVAVAVTAVGVMLHRPSTGVIAGLVTVIALYLGLRYMAAKTLLKFTEQLPEVFQALATELRTRNLTQAFHAVSRDLQEPAASELATVYRQIDLQGVELREALHQLLQRQPSSDLEVGVNVILIQNELGGNGSQLLNSLANTIRVRRRTETDIRLATQQVRYEVWIVAGLVPVLAVILNTLNPGYLNPLFRPGVGLFLLFIAGALVLLGIVWTLYLVRGDY